MAVEQFLEKKIFKVAFRIQKMCYISKTDLTSKTTKFNIDIWDKVFKNGPSENCGR